MENEIEKFYTWWFDATSIFLRYFLLAGVGYFIFYVWKQQYFKHIKLQDKIPSRSIIQKEILYSIFTLCIHCLASWIIFYWERSGYTKIYLDVRQYGYFYFFLSFLLMVIVHDAYFYWTHRFMHLPKVFHWFHKRHHLSHNPTPWAAFSFHPLEAIVSVGFIPIIVFIIPAHPFAIFTFLGYMVLINVMGHLGYEVLPEKFRKNKVGKWQNTSTNHNIHHKHSQYNYGLYFTFWDRVMSTYNEKLNNE